MPVYAIICVIFMEYAQVLSAVEALSPRGMDFGLSRTRALLDGLGSPDGKLKIIHISGSNGKGSVAEYVTHILLAAGKTVGTFTSPAVYDYLEQFRINGENISRAAYARAFGEAVEFGGSATQFEVETAGAINAFAFAGCEYAVVECGLGGTYDATNAVLRKEIALISSVSLEHVAVLGNTLESICSHKAGIIKDCPAVVSALNLPEVISYFKKRGAFVADGVKITGEKSFSYRGRDYELKMEGCAQPYNAAVAIECAKRLNIAESAVYMGVKRAELPARLQKISAGGNEYLLDGAHNPAAFAPLVGYLKSIGGAECVIFGSLSDKDVRGNLENLKGLAKRVIAVTPHSPRAMAAEEVARICAECGLCAEVADGVENALERAAGTVVVCGSFTILNEAADWICKRL